MSQSFVIAPPPVTALTVDGSTDAFPVRRVFCVGKNYADHVREMGGDPKDTPPVFFTKPADAAIPADDSGSHVIAYPPMTEDLHYEAELVVALQSGGRDIAVADALGCVYGYGVGIDFTRRDIQRAMSKAGHPWDMAKGFDQSGIVGPITPLPGQDYTEGRISLSVDGETKQDAPLSDMIWKLPEIISTLSRFVALKPGDIIFTGTPAGVGPVVKGNRLNVSVDGLPSITLTIG